MLSVGQNARRFSPSQNIHVTKSALHRIGNVHYRQQIPTGAPWVNRVGKPDGVLARPKTRLGTGIVKALAQQPGAKVETLAGPEATTVSVTRATFFGKDVPCRVKGGKPQSSNRRRCRMLAPMRWDDVTRAKGGSCGEAS